MNTKVNSRGGFALAIVIVMILSFVAIYLQMQNNKTRMVLNGTFDKSFFELVEYINNMETLLSKAQISNTAEYSAKNLTEIWRQANLAESALAQIPVTHTALVNTQKFINQVGDYSYSLSRKTIEGDRLTEEDFNNLEIMRTKCNKLNMLLEDLTNNLATKSISWDELRKEKNNAFFAQEVANISQDSFGNIEKGLQDYEGLIYDGPFSEHMTSIEPKGLGEDVYEVGQLKEKINNFVNQSVINSIDYDGEIEGTIVAHRFNVTLKNNNHVIIDFTKLGGKLLWMNYNRDVNQNKISIEEAKKQASKFLSGNGYSNMKESYYTVQDNIATINYAYVQNGVICYTDLIKVKVALDNGDIMGMESKGYLNSHTERIIEPPKISIEEAREIINPKIKIESEGLAIVPTDWSTEVLCYEFKGKVNEKDFIVYVDANTGREQDVFMIIDSENGELAI